MTSESDRRAVSPSEVKVLVGVGLAAAFIRLLYFAEHIGSSFFAVTQFDQKYYDLCARQLAGMGVEGVIDGFRPLLYPLFLSVLYRLGGSMGVVLAILAQHLLGMAVAVLVAFLAARLFRDVRAGAASGVLYVLAGPPLYFEGEILIVTLFTFLLFLTVLLAWQAFGATGRKRVVVWLLVGLLAGLAAQARPNALLLWASFPILVGYECLIRKKRRGLIPLLALLSALSVQAVFGFVNAHYTGSYSFLTSAGGINFYLGNKRGADGRIPRQQSWVTYEEEYRDSIQVSSEQLYAERMRSEGQPVSTDPKTVSDYWAGETIEEIKSAPGTWLALMLKKSWYMLWNHEIQNNKSYAFIAQEESRLLRFMPVRWWLLLALLPLGLCSAWRKERSPFVVWVILVTLLYAAGVMLFFVNSRLRLPLWPLAALMGGGGSIAIVDGVARKEWRMLIWSSAIGLVLLLLSLVNWYGVVPESFARDFYFRGKAHFAKGRFEDAMQDMARSIDIDARNPDAHIERGNAYFALGRYAAAVASYRVAITMDPDEPRAYNNLGAALENSGDLAGAYTAYQDALAVSENHVSTLVNAALLELRAGMLEEASLKIFHAEKQGSGRADVQCARAYLEYRQKTPTWQAVVETARKANPDLMKSLLAEPIGRLTRKDLLDGSSERFQPLEK